MDFRLGPKATASGYRLAAFETIGSTNAEALNRGRAGDPGHLWVVAKAQTAGHGRRGRPWQTRTGNLAASLLMPAERTASIATLGFAAGLALEEAMRMIAPDLCLRMALDATDAVRGGVRLKWPNDVLVDGAKLAGILLEAVSGPDAGGAVIGIGVNVVHAPDDVPYPATSLADCGMHLSAEAVFEALSEAWVEQEALWDHGRGFAAIRRRWLDCAAGLGSSIAVKDGRDVFRGTFETIDEDGRLVVRAPDGSARRIAAGEVHFGAAATVAQ